MHRLADQHLHAIALALAATGAVVFAWMQVPHPLAAPVLALLPIAAVLVIRDPFLLVLGFVIFSFFRIHEAFPFLIPLKLPLLLAMGSISVVALHFMTGRLDTWWRRELTLLMAFFGLVTLGLPLAGDFGVAFGYWNATYIKIIIMVPIIAWLITGEGRFKLASLALVAAGLLIAGVALYNQANGIGLVEGTRVTIARHLGSPIGDPNDLALVLLFPVSFAYGFLLVGGVPWWGRVLGGLALVMLFAGILATQSRGGLLGFVAVSGIFAQRHIRSKVLLGALGGLALMALFAAAGIADRQSGGAHEEGLDASAAGRLHAWEAAMGMAAANPISGVGLNNFYSSYFFYTPVWDGKNHAVHSTWFGVLAETGFPGLALFVCLVAAVVLTAWRTANTLDQMQCQAAVPPFARLAAWAACAGLVGFLVSGTFLTMGFTWPLYIQLGIALAVARFTEKLRISRIHAQCSQ